MRKEGGKEGEALKKGWRSGCLRIEEEGAVSDPFIHCLLCFGFCYNGCNSVAKGTLRLRYEGKVAQGVDFLALSLTNHLPAAAAHGVCLAKSQVTRIRVEKKKHSLG